MKIFDKESHKFADIFPMIEGDGLENLKQDIKEHGQLEPVILYEGKILDGRNRYRVCKELGLNVKTEEYKGEKPLEFVISLNLKRRHLTPSQSGCIANDILPMLEEEARKRSLANLKQNNTEVEKLPPREKSAVQAGKLFNVNEKYVREAKKLKETSPELFEEVRLGRKNFSEIKKEQKKEKIIKQKEELTKKALQEPKGEYDVIAIDPPWSYEQGFSEYDEKGHRGTTPYPVMNLEELKKLKLPMAKDCVVWLWVTNSMFKEAMELTEEWGLERKTILTWNKELMGVGHFLRNITEHCIVCFKGKPYFNNTKWTTLISEKRTTHSTKPEIFYKMVEEICAGKKLDYFARKKRDGWDCYGDEV